MPQGTMHRLLVFSQKHAVAVMLTTALVTVFFGYFALHVRLSSDIESLVPQNSKAEQLMAKYSGGGSNGDYFVVAARPIGSMTITGLGALHAAIVRIDELKGVQPALDPFTYFTFKREKDSRLTVVPLSQGSPVPQTQAELDNFERNLKADPFAKNLIVSNDGTTLAALFLIGTVPSDTVFLNDLNAILSTLSPYYTTYFTGTIPFSQSTRTYLVQDLPKLFILAALVILVMYYVGFRAKRAVILPLLVVTVGTIWCIGFMSLVGFQLTIISVITPPLVLTLGSSYSIHILNQYFREARLSSAGRTEIINSVDHVNKTILLAALTTIFGFMSLLPASMYQLREFGVATSFGILSCAVLSLFFFPAMLSRLPVPQVIRTNHVFEGFLARVMAWLSRFVLRFRIAILCVLGLLVVAFAFSLPHIHYQTDYVSYFPKNAPPVRNLDFINSEFGGFQQMYLTVSAPGGQKNYFLRPDVLKEVASFESKLRHDPLISYSVSFVSYLEYLNQVETGSYSVPTQPGLTLLLSRYMRTMAEKSGGDVYKTLLTQDLSRLTVSFRLFDAKNKRLLTENDLRTELDRIRGYAWASFSPGMDPQVWGGSLRFLDLSRVIRSDQTRSTVISIVLIFLLTALSFRSVRLGLYTLIPLATGIMANYIIMAAAGIPLDMTTVMFSSVAIGVGVDDSIHFVLQFQQQQAATRDITAAIANTLEVAGRPIVLTTAAIVGGLLVLLFGNFQPIIFFGLLVSCALTTAMLGTLIVLPVVLYFDSTARARAGARRAVANRKQT